MLKFKLSITVLPLLTGLFISVLPAAHALPLPWINEIHYDNTGSDAGEFVELAGPTGTDLLGFSLVFYNGGDGSPYATLTLTGIFPDQQNGYGALAFSHSGIQNGSPDGIVLCQGTLPIQFLSYEGTFMAASGVAAGLWSIGLGVSEDSSTPVGWSLQLIGGPGSQYSDFVWTGPAPASTGTINQGQSFRVPDHFPTWVLFLMGLALAPTFAARKVKLAARAIEV